MRCPVGSCNFDFDSQEDREEHLRWDHGSGLDKWTEDVDEEGS